MPHKKLTIEENERLLSYCENHFELKEVQDTVNKEKGFIRELVIEKGEAETDKRYAINLEDYKISVSTTVKTSLADDFVLQIKDMPEILHTVIYSLQVPYNALREHAREIAKGRLGNDLNDADVELVLKEITEKYLIGTGLDEDGLQKAIENQIVSPTKAQKLFKETAGTPSIRISKSK